MKINNVFHKIKFNFWYFSKRFYLLKKPIEILGIIYTSRFIKNYKNKIRFKINQVLPDTRYERPKNISKQFFIIKSKNILPDKYKGIELLLNHFRLPYSVIDDSKEDISFIYKDNQSLILIGCDFSDREIENFKNLLSEKQFKIINFFEKKINDNKDSNLLNTINENPEKLLPYNDGLRSKIVQDFTKILLKSSFPIITGFLVPQIGMRIDDVKGTKIKDYLNILVKHKWKPNLGIFVNDFLKNDKSIISFLSNLNTLKKIEISPHAFSSNKFLFYDFENKKFITSEIFEKNWSTVKKKFTEWGFVISSVVNSHFHVYSKENFNIFKKENIKYIFSENSPSKINPLPDKIYLPSGDPIHTTGQISHDNIYQVYSGDSVLCCNQNESYYDFLMHVKKKNIILRAHDRIIKRINLSLSTGFAAFVTTHEYLLSSLSLDEINDLFNLVDDSLKDNIFSPIKSSLSEIGRACENHTNIIIHSVKKKDNKYIIYLKGKSNGDFYLCLFLNNKINLINFTEFDGTKEVEINI